MQELEFFGKKPARPQKDVFITFPFYQGKRSTRFSFHRGSAEKVTKTGYIEAAIFQNRLYFRESDQEHGYKLNKSSAVEAVVFTQERLAMFFECVPGEYNLQYDNERNYYYIEKGEANNVESRVGDS